MKHSKLLSTLILLTAFSTLCYAKAPKKDKTAVVKTSKSKKARTPKGPKQLEVKNSSNEKETQFKNLMTDLKLSFVSRPNPDKVLYPNKNFDKPFIVEASNSEGPIPNLSITISYPTERADDLITYTTIQLTTGEDGRITFQPDAPTIPIKDVIRFYPTPISSQNSIVELAQSASITSDFLVKSSYTTWPGGSVFVYDYNENGNPIINSKEILAALRNAGLNAGNAPVSEPSYLAKTPKDVYNACISNTQGTIREAAKFLVIGTVKYVEPVTQVEGAYKCTLVADITCLKMRDGSTLYKTSITESVTDKNKSSAVANCKRILADKVKDAVIYGM